MSRRPRSHTVSRWLSRRNWRRGVLLRSLLALLVWVGLWALAADVFGAEPVPPAHPLEIAQIITQATLTTEAGERQVQLPHVLEPADFEPEGSRVRYRMTVNVPDQETLRAIFIQKMSRSGRIWVNGRDMGSCGSLLLQSTRCQHRPQFFRTPYSNWQAGENVIEVEIFATHRQSNGLSQVVVGPREVLFWQWFKPRQVLQVQVIDALTWLMLILGVLALMVYTLLRGERMYFWFGLACLLAALSNINQLVISPMVSIDLFDWTVFASRFLFSCVFGLTYLAYFKQDRPRLVWPLLTYATLSLAAIWWSGSSPKLVSQLYIPLLVLTFVMAGTSVIWAWRSGKRGAWAMALSFLLMPLAGVFDFVRLKGLGSFTGTYITVYASAIVLMLIGISLIGKLALALRTTRDLSSILQTRVDVREAELQRTHQRIVEMEQLRARTDERERILRDMHDGFLSTLALTRTALATGNTTAQQARLLLTECMDDLRLMLEASAHEKGALAEVLADFFHRFENRIAGAGIEPFLHMALDGLPPLNSTALLQMMRIVQEATYNAMRHSGARHLYIRALWDAPSGQLTLEVQDDGNGAVASAERPGSGGRGTRNMLTRAKAIDGDLELLSDETGCAVRLRLKAPTA